MASEQPAASPQIRALHQCSAELVVGLSAADPLISWQLLAKELIGQETVDYCQLEVTQTKKSSKIVCAVIETVSASPHLFKSLVSVLSESGNTALISVGEKLKQTYEKEYHSHSHTQHPPSGASTLPQLQLPVCRYANYLKAIYTRSEIPEYSNPNCYKWIPSPSEKFKFINLAIIDKEKKEAHEIRREITHGRIDLILKRKAPIALENILQVEQGQSLTCVLIEGAPGIGKSMLAWEICHRWGRGELFQEYSVVLLVTLRDERVHRAKCVKDLFYHRDEKLQEEVVQEIDRTNGKGVLILLEGLDELPKKFLFKCSIFTDLLSGKVFPKATVLVTSRSSAIDKYWQKWWQQKLRHIEILGFSDDNINEYSKSVLTDHQLLGFNNYLSIHPHIKSMMYVPLHCAITMAVYLQCQQSDRAPPKTLTGLYTCLAQTILMQYLQDHPDYKGTIHRFDSFSELPSPIYVQFKKLCSLAFNGVNRQKTVFHNLQKPEHFGFMNVTNDLFLQSANISYNFLHLSVQEYLTAYHVSLMSRDQQEQVIRRVRYGDHRFNVVLFLAGMTQLKHLDKKLVKKVIGISGWPRDISEYALEILYECQDVSILESIGCYHTTIQSNDSVHRLVALGYCIAKSNSKWHVTFSDRGNYSGTEVFCHSLKENPHPTYSIESIEFSNCTPDFTQQVLQHLPEYALKRIKEISIQHDDTQPLPPYWHQLEREKRVELTLENVTAASHYWHKYKNEDYCQPLPPCLPELILKMENLKTLTLLNVLDTSLRELIPVLSKIPTLRNLQVSDVNNYFSMQFSKYRCTNDIESANCTPEFLDQLLPALPQQSIAGTKLLAICYDHKDVLLHDQCNQPLPMSPDSLTINYKIGFHMFRSKDKGELDYCQPLPQCLPELIFNMETLNTLTLENVLDTSLTELIPVLSRVPTLRILTLHKLNSEGITLLCQWLPTCQLWILTLFEEVNKVNVVTHANKIIRKISATFSNNSIETIECQYCTTEFIDQILSQIPQQLLEHVKIFTVCNGQYKYREEEEKKKSDFFISKKAALFQRHIPLRMPEIEVIPRMTTLPTPPCLPEVISRMERLETLKLEKVCGTSLMELIPVLSKIPTLRNLQVSDVNSYFNMQYNSTGTIESANCTPEFLDQLLPALSQQRNLQISDVSNYFNMEYNYGTGTIESANCTPEFLDQLLPVLPQQSIADIGSLTINYKIGFHMFRSKDKDELDYCQPLPHCLPELILKMERLNTLTLENVLDTSLIPVLSRVPTLRNLTLHKLNSEGIALLFQWLPTCQLETLTLFEEVNKVTVVTHANKIIRKISATLSNNSIEAIECQYCTTEFMDQILSQIPQQLLEHIKTFIVCNGNECQYEYREKEKGYFLQSASFERHYPLRMPEVEVIPRITTLPTPSCLPEVISRMERLETLKLERVRDTSLMKLIPALSRVSTLKKLTLHELNSEGIDLLCQWLPTCQLKELVIYKEHLSTSHITLTVEVMTVIFSRNLIECLNSTKEFIDQILQKLPQQIIACIETLVIHNEKVEDKNSCRTPPSLPPCLPELLPRMKRLNSLTLKNVLDTSLTKLIPVLSRVPTLRNLTLHELTNSKNIALLCQWLSTSQLSKLTLHEKMEDRFFTHKIEIAFCDNIIEVIYYAQKFCHQILRIVSNKMLSMC